MREIFRVLGERELTREFIRDKCKQWGEETSTSQVQAYLNMHRNGDIIREQEETEASESGVVRRRQPGAPGTNRASAASANSTSCMLSKLIRQSLAGASMLQHPEGAHCSLCGLIHRGPCRVIGPSGPSRPKSVFVKSTSMETDHDWPWMMRALDNSRRASIDTSELADADYSSNIWNGPSLNPAANDKAKQATGLPVCERVNQEENAESRRRGRNDDKRHMNELMDDANNIDRGYAWVILAVLFLINASTFGTARAYGLIYHKLVREGGQTRARAAMPFTIMGAVENMCGPICGCLLALTGSWRLTVVTGSFLVTLGHLLAAMSSNSQLGQLVSMGLVCGFGMSFISISFFQVNNAYFVRYRSIAFGIGLSGATFGTLIISPTCQYFLNNYEGTRMCYLVLGAFIAPNIPLALLLKPSSKIPLPSQNLPRVSEPENSLSTSNSSVATSLSNFASTVDLVIEEPLVERGVQQQECRVKIDDKIPLPPASLPPLPPLPQLPQLPPPPPPPPVGQQIVILDLDEDINLSPWAWIKLVFKNPYFHLIWPTHMLYCWLNFVYSMIIVDFSKDRAMSDDNIAYLLPMSSFGQLFGRLLLSGLVDLKLISNKSFTIICFLAIGITTYLLNNIQFESATCVPAHTRDMILLAHVFVISMFIALLYILLNGLVVLYVEPALQPISFGMSSFTGSFFLLPRATVIGHYRDTFGNYDALLAMFTYVCLIASLVWLVMPPTITYLKDLSKRRKNVSNISGHVNLATTISTDDLGIVETGNKTVTFGSLDVKVT